MVDEEIKEAIEEDWKKAGEMKNEEREKKNRREC